MASLKPRALIIGIDGGSFDSIDPLVAENRLPNLARLLREGVSARTACTWPAHTAPGWSSYVTGCQPGEHAIYQFFDTQSPDYGAKIRQAEDLGRTSAWDWLATQNYTLGLINIPMSHPPSDLPGYQVTWPLQQTVHYCRPRSILGELAKNDAHFQSDLATMFRGDYAYLDEAEVNVKARLRSVLHLMNNRPTDIVMVVFTEVDRVGHHYWHYVDPGHPRHEPAPEGSGWESALVRIYEAVDAAIGELIEDIDDETAIVLVSDHGLGVGRYGLAVNRLLEEAGLLVTKAATAANGHGSATASWFTNGEREVDFDRTRVYMPVPGSYGLNLNRAGRQRLGTVGEHDRKPIVGEVTDLLMDVRLPGEGRAFRDIIPREIAFAGRHMESAPDLLLVPRDESVLVTPDIVGELWQPSWQTGLHRYAGMWLQVSKNVRPGRLPGVVSLTDLMPTLLAELGASWPTTIHGRPVPAALPPGHELPGPSEDLERAEAEHDASQSRPTSQGSASQGSDAEDSYTSRRLREMGYI